MIQNSGQGMMKTLGKKPMWAAVLLLIAMASLAAGALSPQLTKTGALQAAVAERIVISKVASVDPGSLNVLQTGSEHFEASWLQYIGEQAHITLTLQNQGDQRAIAKVVCNTPSGVLFAVDTKDDASSASGGVARVGTNEYAASIEGGSTQPFELYFKGLSEGQFNISCTIGEFNGPGL